MESAACPLLPFAIVVALSAGCGGGGSSGIAFEEMEPNDSSATANFVGILGKWDDVRDLRQL